jgi:hypothetical protein
VSAQTPRRDAPSSPVFELGRDGALESTDSGSDLNATVTDILMTVGAILYRLDQIVQRLDHAL